MQQKQVFQERFWILGDITQRRLVVDLDGYITDNPLEAKRYSTERLAWEAKKLADERYRTNHYTFEVLVTAEIM